MRHQNGKSSEVGLCRRPRPQRLSPPGTGAAVTLGRCSDRVLRALKAPYHEAHSVPAPRLVSWVTRHGAGPHSAEQTSPGLEATAALGLVSR